MTDKRFPLCDRLNLQLHKFQLNKITDTWSDEMISAADLEKLLENLPVVSGYRGAIDGQWILGSKPDGEGGDTHSARILLIEPIKRESAEDLLREIVESKSTVDWLDRAKAFLEREKEREGL